MTANIRLGYIGLAVTNILAYCNKELIRSVKSFRIHPPILWSTIFYSFTESNNGNIAIARVVHVTMSRKSQLNCD